MLNPDVETMHVLLSSTELIYAKIYSRIHFFERVFDKLM